MRVFDQDLIDALQKDIEQKLDSSFVRIQFEDILKHFHLHPHSSLMVVDTIRWYKWSTTSVSILIQFRNERNGELLYTDIASNADNVIIHIVSKDSYDRIKNNDN